jgi:hypothetical protein
MRIEPFTRDSRVAILKDGAKIPIRRSGLVKLKAIFGKEM